MELQSLNISAGLEQLNTELYDYDPNTDDYKEDAAPESIDGVNSYMRAWPKTVPPTSIRNPPSCLPEER